MVIFITSDQKEVDYFRKVFVKINDYPSKPVEKIIKNKLRLSNINITNESQTNTTDNSETKVHLFLPLSGKQNKHM